MRGSDIKWPLYSYEGKDELYVNFVGPKGGWESPYSELDAMADAEKIPAVLEALEDPERVVAAVYFLSVSDAAVPDMLPAGMTRRPDGSFCYTYYGLRVDLSDVRESGSGVSPGGVVSIYGARTSIDPAQFALLRAHLHRHLDNRLAVLRYPGLVAGSMVVPACWFIAWYWRTARRHRRRMQNHCLNCGYDLRATRGRCPECGGASDA